MQDSREIFEPRISIITLGVRDLRRSIEFYRDGLGFPTTAEADAEWAIFRTSGTRFSLYPREKLAEDISPALDAQPGGFGGVTLAHNTRDESGVDAVLALAKSAGGTILKPAQMASWGGYSGYFGDPDGYPWEVAWHAAWQFDDDGTLWGDSLGEPPAG